MGIDRRRSGVGGGQIWDRQEVGEGESGDRQKE